MVLAVKVKVLLIHVNIEVSVLTDAFNWQQLVRASMCVRDVPSHVWFGVKIDFVAL